MTPGQIIVNHMAALEQLEITALQVKAQRDEAVRLLRDAFNHPQLMELSPSFKASVREFLESLHAPVSH